MSHFIPCGIMEVIVISDKQGHIKKKIKVDEPNKYKTQISISDLNPDTYVIRIYDGKTWYSSQIIKK